MTWNHYGGKYNNKKVVIDGITFDSRKEGKRYLYLKRQEEAGEIFGLKLQESFELIPSQYEPDIIGPRGGRKRGRCIEKACTYKADFMYGTKDGALVVEDAKGMRTEVYKIKKKLMLHIFGIRIKEV